MFSRFLRGWPHALLGAVAFVLPAPVPADLHGLELVSESTPSDTTALKQLVVACPSGKVAVNGGAATSNDQARLLQTTPNGDPPTGWLGLASELGPGDPWSLTVSVWCADPPPGFERIGAVTDTNPGSFKFAITFCPAGKELLGAGGQVFLSFAQKGLSSIQALDGSVGISAQDGGGGGAWGVRADVMCANSGTLGSVFLIEGDAFGVGPPTGGLTTSCPEDFVALASSTTVTVSGVVVPTWLYRNIPSGGTHHRWRIATHVLGDNNARIQSKVICVLRGVFSDSFESAEASVQ